MTALDFNGRVAIVTGAGGGLGASYAEALAARGAKVLVNDLGTTLEGEVTDTTRARQQVERIRAAGGVAVANGNDVSSEQGARQLVEQALDEFGRIDIVINNAGNFVSDGPLTETTNERFDSLWRVHVLGTVNILRTVWPHLMGQGYGRVINTASSGGYHAIPGKYEYDTVKAAIHGLTLTLALECAGHGVLVNTLCPGGNTRSLRDMQEKLPPNTLPSGYFGPAYDPALVAAAVVWLAHESCEANGETFLAMSGTVKRLLVVENEGFFSRELTPELLARNAAAVRDTSTLAAAKLTLPPHAVEQGGRLVDVFDAAG